MTPDEKRQRLREILEAVADAELKAGAKKAENLLWMASQVDCIPEGHLAFEEREMLSLYEKARMGVLLMEEATRELCRIRFKLP
ncbi:MAG: hypothetical protein ACP59X_21125 [Solidesulfovibrio sp. DCME]|uniref:hypothetical protein n=1 Tax=Solidesulfovibrio sp. DCME TaxID=3447380 RepID=UPI003D10FED7